MPVAAELGAAQRHDHGVARASPDLLVTARADVFLSRFERLDAAQLGEAPGERILDEGAGRLSGTAPAGGWCHDV